MKPSLHHLSRPSKLKQLCQCHFRINHVIIYLERNLPIKINADIPGRVVLINVELKKLSLSIRPSERDCAPFNLFAVFSFTGKLSPHGSRALIGPPLARWQQPGLDSRY